jgi:alginate O-acetyltransferase complex protein AlgI
MIQSVSFWALLAVTVPCFWLLPVRLRMMFLGTASAAFVAWLEPWTAAALAAWTLLFFFVAPLARKDGPWARRAVPFLLLAVLAHLGYHKYFPRLLAAAGFAEESLVLITPLGISYFTFKLAHYAIEVGRGNIQDRRFSTFATYIFLFPIYTAGPIERFDHFLANRAERFDEEHLVVGSLRIIRGLVKKMVIGEMLIRRLYGNQHSAAVLLANLDRLGPVDTWRFVILTFLFAYMDFSAYSDIAIGASRLYGIKILENFRWPVFASNIGDFWKRWHMTLAGWCQAYVYMPVIGLTRRPYVAVYATFITMGLWHAGTLGWILWGAYHATGVSVFLTWSRLKRRYGWLKRPSLAHRVAATLLTFLFVSGGFAFTVTYGSGGAWESLRLFASLFGIPLPA